VYLRRKCPRIEISAKDIEEWEDQTKFCARVGEPRKY
jgi:hypothetical protein